jgi:alpha-L-rhamnosidase
MYRVVAGIDTYEDGVGYKHIRIMPHPGGGLAFARADLATYYGKVSAHWEIVKGRFLLDVEIPGNTTATIYIPGTDPAGIRENGQSITSSAEMSVQGIDGNYVVVNAGSGTYHFAAATP